MKPTLSSLFEKTLRITLLRIIICGRSPISCDINMSIVHQYYHSHQHLSALNPHSCLRPSLGVDLEFNMTPFDFLLDIPC